MRLTTRLFVPAICFVTACAGSSPDKTGSDPTVDVDGDGDGLSDDQESDLGSDPDLADTDGDGLDDGVEVADGTDPLAADTDEDGYSDAAERSAKTDALDPSSVIYQGGWPYNIEKAALNNPTFAGPIGAAAAGTQFPDLVGVDQFGDLVHLYDFANLGKPVMIDFSAQWCGPCNALADYLTGADNGFSFPNLRTAIENGDVYWITIMAEDFFSAPATGVTSTEWALLHPDERIPVLAPPNPMASRHYIDLVAFPTMVWLDEGMTILLIDNENPYLAAEALESELSSQ